MHTSQCEGEGSGEGVHSFYIGSGKKLFGEGDGAAEMYSKFNM